MHPAVARSLFVKRPEPIKSFLVASVGAHVFLLLVGLGYQYFVAGPTMDLDQKPIKASLVRLGKPRDENLLPRKEELPPPPQKSEGASEPVKVPAPADKAVAVPIPGVKPAESKTQKSAGEDKGVDRRKSLFSAFNKSSKATKVEELEGQLDGNPLGDSATAEGDQYFALLTAQIKRHYDVSETIPDSERIRLKAVAKLFISKTGDVLRVEITRPSGNALFDNAVKAAARKASPVSPPPEHLRDQLARSGLSFEFTP